MTALESSNLKNVKLTLSMKNTTQRYKKLKEYLIEKLPIPEQEESMTCPSLKTKDCVEISSLVLHEFSSPSIQNSAFV